jgi:hypothetical protein
VRTHLAYFAGVAFGLLVLVRNYRRDRDVPRELQGHFLSVGVPRTVLEVTLGRDRAEATLSWPRRTVAQLGGKIRRLRPV